MTVTQIDVLIVGAGPVGLFAAANFLKLGHSVRIVDIEFEPNHWGRGDWVHGRTLEILEQFGFAQDLLESGAKPNKIINYKHGVQKAYIPFVPDSESTYHKYVCCVGQHVTESILQNFITQNDVNVERPVTVSSFEIPDDVSNSHPVIATIQNMSTGESEIVQCKYLLGCDGAHSDIRKKLGFAFQGETTELHSGVLDAKIKTNFPTTKEICILQSDSGCVSLTPRENGLTRIFVHFQPDQRDPYNRNKIQLEEILKEAKRAFLPFRIEFLGVLWWTVYVVGQRVVEHMQHSSNRVFLCGDSCHSHSPTLGQGLNTGLGDVFNLVWKIHMAEQKLAPRSILDTYEQERRPVAQEVINIDKEVAELAQSGVPRNQPNIDTEKDYLHAIGKHQLFNTGFGISYPVNIFNDEGTSMATDASTIVLSGHRAPDSKVVCIADGKKVRLFDAWNNKDAVCRFKVVVFAGDLAVNAETIEAFYKRLEFPESFLHKYTANDEQSKSLFVLLAVTTSSQTSVVAHPSYTAITSYPLFVDKLNNAQCHQAYGVDVHKGAIVVVRPDGYIAYSTDLFNYLGIDDYFERVLLPRPL